MKSRIRAQREPPILVLENNPAKRVYGGFMSRKQKGGHSLDAYARKPESQAYVLSYRFISRVMGSCYPES